MKHFRISPRLAAQLVALFVCFAALAAPLHAQTNKGTIIGTITDPQGGLVNGARVTATNKATKQTAEAVSDEGIYTIPNLDPGDYTVTIEATGFSTVVNESVRLETNARLPLDAQLAVASAAGEVVTVTAEAPVVESETSVRGDIITGREVTDLPIAQRNFTLLAALSPGVSRPAAGTIGGGGNFEAGGPGNSTESTRFRESGGSVIVANGARPTNNNFTLDGIDNNETQFGQIAIFPSTEEIAEFKVETSVYSAESGRAGGAIVSATTKSGKNRVFGNLYEYYQGRFASALPSRLTQPGTTFIPNANTHNFGGIVGGPIFLPRFGEGGPTVYDGRDKSFFFFSYNGQRNATPAFNTAEDPITVPTARQRTGDFSEFLFPGQTREYRFLSSYANPTGAPCRPDPNNAGRQLCTFTRGTIFDRNGVPFAGNRIPSNLFSPSAFRLLNSYPLPTDPGTDRNYRRNRKENADINGYSIRLDHNFTESNSAYVRYSKQENIRTRDNNFPLGSSPTGIDLASGFGAGEEFGNSRQIALGNTQVFSPTVVNDMRAGYHRVNIGIFNPGIGGSLGFSPTVSADLGMPNINVCGVICEGTVLLGFAPSDEERQLEFVGDGGPFFFNSNNFFFGDVLSIVRGNQTYRIGGDFRVRQNRQVDAGRAGGSKGNVQYGTSVGGFASGSYGGAAVVGSDDAGSSVANFLLGNSPAFITRGNPGEPALLSNKEIAFFVQDDWKVTPTLTLNLGLRYDLYTLPTERYNRQSNLDPATGQLVLAGEGASFGRSLAEADKNNFGPRVGFAYSGFRDDRKLVVRGGYGLTYALDISGRPPLTFNAPFSSGYSVSFNQFGTPGSPVPARFNLDTGYPYPQVSVPSGGTFRPGQFDNIFFLDPENKTTMFHQYNLTGQYEFAQNWLAEIAYVGALGRNLLNVSNIGQGSNGPGSREVAGLNTVVATRNVGESRYDSFQSKLERRFTRGLALISTYVWSHSIDNTSGGFPGLGNTGGNNFGFSNPLNRDLDRGNSDFDIRHRFTLGSVYDLPFGQGRRFGSDWSGPMEFFLGGFQINTNIQIQSGPPFTPRFGDVRPDLVGDPTPTAAQRAAGLQLNPAAFREPVTRIFPNDPNSPRFGTLGRNTFRGERQEYVDASLFKNFRLPSVSETLNIQFRLSAFNLFNHVNRSTPERNIQDGNFGRDTSEQRRRQLEFGFKLIF